MSTRGGHLERTAAEPRYKELHSVKIGRIDQVNERVRLFRLELQSGPVKFLAGQWLDTYVPDVPKAGGFTITSAPSAAANPGPPAPYLELAVQESPGNAPAAWLWRPVSEILGETLQVRIGGSFVFPPTDIPGQGETLRNVVFVAGGVGVNPLMSMLSHLADEPGDGIHVDVLYSSKMPAGGVGEVLFLDRIASLFGGRKLAGRLRLQVTDIGDTELKLGTQTVNGAEVDVRRGRISHEMLTGLVLGEHRDSTLVYICGPPAMTDEFVGVLTDDHGVAIDSRRVKTENWW